MNLSELFETNVLNLFAVWICLYFVLRPSFAQAITSYTDKLNRTRTNLETDFARNKTIFADLQSVSEESLAFQEFVTKTISKKDGIIADFESFEFSKVSDNSLELPFEHFHSKLNILIKD